MPRRKNSTALSQKERFIKARLMKIQREVDQYVYKFKPILEAETYLHEMESYHDICSHDPRSKQVLEKLTYAMKEITTEQQAGRNIENNLNVAPTELAINVEYGTQSLLHGQPSPVYSLPEEDRLLTQYNEDIDDNNEAINLCRDDDDIDIQNENNFNLKKAISTMSIIGDENVERVNDFDFPNSPSILTDVPTITQIEKPHQQIPNTLNRNEIKHVTLDKPKLIKERDQETANNKFTNINTPKIIIKINTATNSKLITVQEPPLPPNYVEMKNKSQVVKPTFINSLHVDAQVAKKPSEIVTQSVKAPIDYFKKVAFETLDILDNASKSTTSKEVSKIENNTKLSLIGKSKDTKQTELMPKVPKKKSKCGIPQNIKNPSKKRRKRNTDSNGNKITDCSNEIGVIKTFTRMPKKKQTKSKTKNINNENDLSWIKCIKYVREVDKAEYHKESYDEYFWNNFTLPSNLQANDFVV